ncbi:DNA ligase D [Hansschlegelia quercus]|uniref:DNA ligase (ATP) n=1 Tax=Hansschlegelia quercus TaxID=2528245 RepID=A0A4Q9GTX3_9HYPH|nr:DNA ligase D [Hansschlegelia quercus]TBN55277.1 DNA ligase D [Hansschlegelia quercus]
MALETYKKKRDFKKTKEPAGDAAYVGDGDSYLIQKHDATRLHYDLRLEFDGVLKSWAVTKGPSLVPGEKRLAVQTEDHPLEYGTFEGTIPAGEYGGGAVVLWDRGRWSPIGDAAYGFNKGHLEFELKGEKLKGRWHLVRMAKRRGEKHDNWLLIKSDDEEARGEGDPDILEEKPNSVKTGRTLAEIAKEAPGWSSETGKIEKEEGPTETVEPPGDFDVSKIAKAKRGELASFVEPQLASLSPKAPAGARWLHEIKFDGYRLIVRIEAGRVKMLTRSGLDWTTKFGKPIVEAFKALPVGSAMIDGELVVENDSGASDFSALQADLSDGRGDRFSFYAFDLLHLDGYDLRPAKLVDRKAALSAIVPPGGTIRVSEHFDDDGSLVLGHACRLSLEGVVSKERDAPYRSGRGKGWIKSKCSKRQEFVIGGYVMSTTSRKAIGSLILGVYDKGELRHVGRVGTGFSVKVAEDLFAKMQKLKAEKSPFASKLTADEARGARYVEAKLVAEVEFRAWTGDGHLRHASFRGLREDKPAEEVAAEDQAVEVKGPKERPSSVKLTHPDRVYWPEDGVTKQGLADYYMEVWPRIAPFIVNRPLSLVRCPGGVTQQCFFQKHGWKGMSNAIKTMPDPQNPADEPMVMIDDRDGLLGLVQGGTLEIHPWGAPRADIDKPDMIIMDLDPGDGVKWETVIEAALEVKRRLEAAGLAAFVKTSGGKGLHVVSPLTPSAGWDETKAFCKAMADSMSADEPEKYVSVVSKAKRGGKILVDYLRNGRGATAVAPYSTRARPGAAVSAPLTWDELGPAIGPAYFTVSTMPTRLASLQRDPWEGFRKSANPLPAGEKKGRKKAA